MIRTISHISTMVIQGRNRSRVLQTGMKVLVRALFLTEGPEEALTSSLIQVVGQVQFLVVVVEGMRSLLMCCL